MSVLSIIKKIFRIPILFLLVLFIFVLGNTLNNARIIGYFTFSDGLNDKIERATLLLENAKQGHIQSIPRAGDSYLSSGWSYRFDLHLADARLENLTDALFEPSEDIVFSFDDPASLPMRPSGDQYVVKEGVLVYRHSPDNILTSDSSLSIPRDEIGDIELKVKVARSDELQLCWSALPDAGMDDYRKFEQIKITTIPDSQFHIYRIPGMVMESWLHTRDRTIRKIYMAPMNPETFDDIEIDYIRFAPRDAKFAERPFGADYEKINAEMRKIMYLHSGYELRYDLTIPQGVHTFFKCGIAVLKETPVSVSLIIKGPDSGETLVSDDFSSQTGWRDLKIDLSGFKGKEATVIFRAEADVPNIVFFSSPILYSPPEKKQNFIIVIEDALRADRMSCFGHDRKTTPFKDNWRHEGILFQKTYSQSSFTRSSCTSLLTSLYPSATGVWNNADRLSDNYTTLAEILYQQGYATALFSQNTNMGPFSGLHQGFGTVIDNEILGKRAPGIYGGEVLSDWLADHLEQNIFVFILVLDPHYPFDPPEEVSAPYRDKDYLLGRFGIPHDPLYDPQWLKRVTFESRNFLYEEEIRYNDMYFPELLDTLRDQGIYDDTLLIFTSDHGEHMGEHYLWNHQPPNYRRVLHVPMIMVYPRLFPAGVEVRQPVQLLDIMPTLLDIAGIPLNRLIIQGDSLLPFLLGKIPWSEWDNRLCFADEVRFSTPKDPIANGGIFFKHFHIMSSDRHADLLSHRLNEKGEQWFNLFSRTQVFDIARNPDETANLVNFLADGFFTYRVRNFHNHFRKINLALHEQIAGDSGKTVIYDSTTIEQLKSLGYIQ